MPNRHPPFLARLLPALLLACALLPLRAGGALAAALAAALKDAQTIQVLGENDFPFGADRWNTGEVHLGWLSAAHGDGLGPDDGRSSGFDPLNLPLWPRTGFARRLGLSAGLAGYTPRSLQVAPPPADDRPYAGLLYAAVSGVSQNSRQSDVLELQLGLVGPSSRFREVQDAFHDNDAKGWPQQLRDEPAFLLAWRRTWRPLAPAPKPGWGADLLPHAGGAAGTLAVFADAGAELRLGWNLPSDFATPKSQPAGFLSGPASAADPRLTGDAGAYLFLAADGRAVARNLFLDGNTWRSSPGIAKEPLVADVSLGLALLAGPVRLAVAPSLRTREFKGQDDAHMTLSASLSATF